MFVFFKFGWVLLFSDIYDFCFSSYCGGRWVNYLDVVWFVFFLIIIVFEFLIAFLFFRFLVFGWGILFRVWSRFIDFLGFFRCEVLFGFLVGRVFFVWVEVLGCDFSCFGVVIVSRVLLFMFESLGIYGKSWKWILGWVLGEVEVSV